MDSIAGSLDGVADDLRELCILSIKSTLDTTSDDPQKQPEFVASLLQQVADASCPGEPTLCSGRGTCKRGRCHCDAGEQSDCMHARVHCVGIYHLGM